MKWQMSGRDAGRFFCRAFLVVLLWSITLKYSLAEDTSSNTLALGCELASTQGGNTNCVQLLCTLSNVSQDTITLNAYNGFNSYRVKWLPKLLECATNGRTISAHLAGVGGGSMFVSCGRPRKEDFIELKPGATFARTVEVDLANAYINTTCLVYTVRFRADDPGEEWGLHAWTGMVESTPCFVPLRRGVQRAGPETGK